MLIDFGKIIGGPDEGDGLVGGVLGLFALGGAAAGTGAMDGVGGGATAAEAATGFGRAAAAEGFSFGRFFAGMDFFDYYILSDILEGRFSQKAKQAWAVLSESVKEVATAHGFMLQQLRTHGLSELAEEYGKLGLTLPDGELLKKTYRALSKELHPDKNPLNGEMMKVLTNANAVLGDNSKLDQYRAALSRHADTLQEFYSKFTDMNVDWAKEYAASMQHKAMKEGRLLEGGAAKKLSQAEQWFKELSPNQRTGLVFGAVAAVGVGVYVAAKAAERKQTHKKQQSEATPLPKQQALTEQLTQTSPSPAMGK